MTMERGEPALDVVGLTMTFGGVRALSDVHLSVAGGEVCGLIGPNGAGKTTLFDCVTGVTQPTSGAIRLLGEEVTRRSATWRARRGLRRTFQRQQTFGWLPVEDNVLVALDWHGGGGGLAGDLTSWKGRRARERERRLRVREVLDVCGLAEVASEPAANLPTGRARMVELARAVVDHPAVLLLDEPTSGLEDSEVSKLGGVIQRLRQQERCAILLVEHDVRFVMRHSDRVVVLDLGEVIAQGPPEAVRDNPDVRAAYLG